MKSIVIVSHKFLTQPDDELFFYLNKKKIYNLLHIMHSFSDSNDRCSYYRFYKQGILIKEYRSMDFNKLPEPLIYLKELITTFRFIYSTNVTYDKYIGMDGLCVFFGIILKFLRKVKRVIFWSIDFVPNNRFSSDWKNKIYHSINILGYKGSDEIWDLSPRMLEAREKFLGIKSTDYKLHKVVPYGMWVDEVKTYSYDEINPYTIVFMGHLLEKQGVQLVLESLPSIIKEYPKVRFKIIGAGNYKSKLEEKAESLGVLKHCDFLGKIEDIKILENEVAKSTVAVAPYIRHLDTWTFYADPGKIKTYLACGVPVILTDIPWNANEIVINKCGLIVKEDKDCIANSIKLLFKKNTNILYRNNSKQYSKSFNYKNIFKNLI
jgi:glycosyltransferase involved in cell wall biosynthesis